MKDLEKLPWFGRRYQPLVQDESDRDATFSDSSSETKTVVHRISASRMSSVYVYWNIVFFCLSSLMLIWSVLRGYGFGSLGDQHKRAWRTVNAPSPIIDVIDLPLRMQTMKGSVVNVDNDMLRQSPSPEVDEAWGKIVLHEASWVSSQDLIDMGKDPSVAVHIPPEYGAGDDAYAVETDMLHKIHCLNRIRKDVYFDYYWGKVYPNRESSSELHQWHTNHCIYILLQSLMCDANTDIIPLVWREIQEHPAQDFNLNRKCGNFEGVKQWTRDRSISYDIIYNLKMPPGQKMAPMNLEFNRILKLPDPEEPWIKNGSVIP